MKITLLSAAIALTAGAAFAQSATESTGVNSALGLAPSTQDFVTQASASGLFEIESSKLALTKGDTQTKTFAQQMITDHEKANSELTALLSSSNVSATPATALPEDLREEVDSLAKLQDSEFNEEYIDSQVDAHEDAVDLFKRYAEGGDNADLKAWAGKTLPVLQHHYEMVQQMDKD